MTASPKRPLNGRPKRSPNGHPKGAQAPDEAPRLDPVTKGQERPGGPGLYLHWDGRRHYRTRMPAPRVLEPVKRYSYGESTGSRVIEGDNLQVMVSLRSQYRSRVDVAYLDPPYNTGRKDFRYSDQRFHDPNADSDDAVYVNSEDGGRHTKWLNYMGPRLYLVWELLADHGVCFVSINDIELFRLGLLMDEIFNERNRVGVLVWKGAIDNNPTRIVAEHEYVLVYAKNKELIDRVWTGEHQAQPWLWSTYQGLKQEHTDLEVLEKAYQKAITQHVRAYKRDIQERGESDLVDLGRAKRYKYIDERGPYAAEDNTHNPKPGGQIYDVRHPVTRRIVKKPSNGYRFPPERFDHLLADGRIVFGPDETTLFKVKAYVSEMTGPLRSVFTLPAKSGALRLQSLLPPVEDRDRFLHPKPVELIESLLSFAGNSSAVVLDPFAGSGTTGHAVLSLNAKDGGSRRFLLVEEGMREDRFCRTLTAARLREAIKQEGLAGGFAFETVGKRVDRDVILELEREAIGNLIIQTDVTGVGRGITKLNGKYVIGANARNEAIALRWNGRARSRVDREVLRTMFQEAKELGLSKPLRVYGTTCTVGETDSFRFCQIPDEILAALQLVEEEAETKDQALSGTLETLESAVQVARSGAKANQ